MEDSIYVGSDLLDYHNILFLVGGEMINIVELVADEEDCAFDQRCKYGHRVECHAVYCHNNEWEDAPTKCRRTWYWGRDEKGKQDEDCPGYAPNPNYNFE